MDPMATSNISTSSSMLLEDLHDSQLEEDALIASLLAEEEEEALLKLDCDSDAALALILQKQFDLEEEENSRLEDSFQQTTSSESDNITSLETGENGNELENEVAVDENVDSREAWDVFEENELKCRSRLLGRSGFVLDHDGNMITKHDIPTSSRKNMCRLMELKTDIQTGDAGATKDDFKITNYVYNKLKVHSKKSSKRASQRLFDKNERKNTAILEDIQSVKMNVATRAIMDGLLIGFRIEKLNGVIGHGKESTVLHATGRDHEDNPGQEVAVKIFKTNTNVAFKNRDSYNKSKCPSYKFDKPRSKHDSLNKWAERGFKNLKLLRKADINCPDAISLKKHVLIMTFLGRDASPSPQLKEAKLDEAQLRASYEQVIDIMTNMYNKCDLIHGDLSEYNLLWHKDQVYVIDVSQSMFTSHPNANRFLFRDCRNVAKFYKKCGLDNIMDERSLFMLICGKDLCDKDIELWSKIESFPQNEKLMRQEEAVNENYELQDNFKQLLEGVEKKETLQEGN